MNNEDKRERRKRNSNAEMVIAEKRIIREKVINPNLPIVAMKRERDERVSKSMENNKVMMVMMKSKIMWNRDDEMEMEMEMLWKMRKKAEREKKESKGKK